MRPRRLIGFARDLSADIVISLHNTNLKVVVTGFTTTYKPVDFCFSSWEITHVGTK